MCLHIPWVLPISLHCISTKFRSPKLLSWQQYVKKRCAYILFNTEAYRPVARQRPRSKQLNSSRFSVLVLQTTAVAGQWLSNNHMGTATEEQNFLCDLCWEVISRTCQWVRSRDSSVSIATGYGLDDQGGGSSSPDRVKNFHFSISSRPSLGSTQPPIKWVPGALSRG
jgi:hypothetical protein